MKHETKQKTINIPHSVTTSTMCCATAFIEAKTEKKHTHCIVTLFTLNWNVNVKIFRNISLENHITSLLYSFYHFSGHDMVNFIVFTHDERKRQTQKAKTAWTAIGELRIVCAANIIHFTIAKFGSTLLNDLTAILCALKESIFEANELALVE